MEYVKHSYKTTDWVQGSDFMNHFCVLVVLLVRMLVLEMVGVLSCVLWAVNLAGTCVQGVP